MEENKHLKQIVFDPDMPVDERIERHFIKNIEVVGILSAIVEWMFHSATEQEIASVYFIADQELDKKTRSELGLKPRQRQR